MKTLRQELYDFITHCFSKGLIDNDTATVLNYEIERIVGVHHQDSGSDQNCVRCGSKGANHSSKLCYGCWMMSDPDDFTKNRPVDQECGTVEISDEEIEEYLLDCPEFVGESRIDEGIQVGFRACAKWMRELIKERSK